MRAINRYVPGALAGVAVLAAASAHSATVAEFDNTKVTLGGYIKFDALVSSFSDGTLSAGNIGRDFYIPSLTPVGGTEENTVVDFHARQSRINFATTSDVDGHKLKSYMEMDFQTTPNGDERFSNSYSPRVRHAFLSYDNWLFGQTWSTFQNVGALPETVDFIGNTDFGIFVRQSQIRYTNGGWQFALENPESTITPFGGGGRIVADDNEVPDFVGRYNFNGDSLSFAAAVLIRQLSYNDGATIDESTSSTGLSLSGKYTFGKNDIRFGVNSGSGMGRYIGLNVANGAVIDANGELEAIDSTAYYLAGRFSLTDKVRTNIVLSAIDIDNDITLTGTNATDTTSSVRLNLFYSATDSLSFGGEFTHAARELESGADGTMDRFQFCAKLAF